MGVDPASDRSRVRRSSSRAVRCCTFPLRRDSTSSATPSSGRPGACGTRAAPARGGGLSRGCRDPGGTSRPRGCHVRGASRRAGRAPPGRRRPSASGRSPSRPRPSARREPPAAMPPRSAWRRASCRRRRPTSEAANSLLAARRSRADCASPAAEVNGAATHAATAATRAATVRRARAGSVRGSVMCSARRGARRAPRVCARAGHALGKRRRPARRQIEPLHPLCRRSGQTRPERIDASGPDSCQVARSTAAADARVLGSAAPVARRGPLMTVEDDDEERDVIARRAANSSIRSASGIRSEPNSAVSRQDDRADLAHLVGLPRRIVRRSAT